MSTAKAIFPQPKPLALWRVRFRVCFSELGDCSSNWQRLDAHAGLCAFRSGTIGSGSRCAGGAGMWCRSGN
eukprot:1949575-Rhodomonas_salina.1